MFEPCVVKKDLQYSCDLCGELPILGRRWCCDVCEDFGARDLPPAPPPPPKKGVTDFVHVKC